MPGGAGGSTPGASGSQPGGAGAGGYASTYSSLNGGNGANGTVWMMAYQ